MVAKRAGVRSAWRRRTCAPNHPVTQSSNHQIRASASGFTLIELMVVMSIIVTLSTLALVQYRHSVNLAREGVLKDDLFKMRDAIDQYYADKNQYPATLDSLVSDGYLRAMPQDPMTRSTTTWQAVLAEPDSSNPSAQPGVFDVKSGSDQAAADGTKYSDW